MIISLADMSFTISLKDTSSLLKQDFFPPIDLKDGQYFGALLSFNSYFSIPNIKENYNNRLHFPNETLLPILDDKGKFIEESSLQTALFDNGNLLGVSITVDTNHYVHVKTTKESIFNQSADSFLIPLGFELGRTLLASDSETYKSDRPLRSVFSASKKKEEHGAEFPAKIQHHAYTGLVFFIETGTYELKDLRLYLQTKLKPLDITLDLRGNLNTLRCELLCSRKIDWNFDDSFGPLLGFERTHNMLANEWNYSTGLVKVFEVTSLNVEVSCILGEWQRDKFSHIIHQFWPDIAPGFRINEIPMSPIYYPVIGDKLESLQVRILDQNGDLVDFRGEEVLIRLHFYRMLE